MIRHILRLLLLIMTSGAISDLHARQTPMIRYTMKDGLPSNTVYHVMRDSRGFLWFGTDKGVARYNGISFQVFTIADGLPDDEIFAMVEDQEHRIWFTPYNGKLCFYKDEKFYNEKNCSFLKLPVDLFMHVQYELNPDSSVTVNGKEYLLNIKKDKITLVRLGKLFADVKNYMVVKAGDNRYWLRSQYKSVLIDTLANIISTRIHDKNRSYSYTTCNNKFAILSEEDSCMYTSVNERTNAPAGAHKLPDVLARQCGLINKVYKDSFHVFYCTQSGLIMDNGDTLIPRGKSAAGVTGICNDLNGDYWVTTHNGVYSIRNMSNGYISHVPVYPESQNKIQFRNGILYFADSTGDHIDTYAGDRVTRLTSHPLKLHAFHVLNEQKIVLFGNGNNIEIIWRGGNMKRRRIDPAILNMGREKIYSLDSAMFLFNSGRALRLYPDSLINYGLKSGIRLLWQGERDRHTRIMASAEDSYNKCVWFSTVDSVYRIKNDRVIAQKGFVKPFRNFFCHGPYLIGYDVNHIVYIFRIQNEETVTLVRSFQEKNVIWEQFYPVTPHKVVATTNNYYQVITFQPNDSISIRPLEDPFIPRNAQYIYGDGDACFFITDGSVTSIPLKNLDIRNDPPAIYFTSLKSGNHSYDMQPSVSITGKEARNINLGFIAVSFDSKEVTYEYSISDDAARDNWASITGNTINLSSPGYGVYYIKLRAKGLSGDYSKPALLTLTVIRPFWLTWWFISAMAAGAIVLIFIITRIIVLAILRRRKRYYELESRYYSAEYKTLNALMNPHFIFNSLNNIKGLMNRDDKKTANKFLNSFSNVVRQNMQNLSKETVSLEEEIQLVAKYLELEQLRFGNIIRYEIKIAPGTDVSEIFIPPLLIQPLAENAVKHGLLPKQTVDGLISIHVYERNRSFFIEVRDNGIGLNNSNYSEHNGYESIGLSNIEKRLSYLRQSGKLQIYFTIQSAFDEQGNTAGTTATIEIRQGNTKE